MNPKLRDGNLPTGKGTFIWLLDRLIALFGSSQALVEQLVADGYQWVCVRAQSGEDLGLGDGTQVPLLDEFCPMAEAAGIEVHGWGWNFGETNLFRKLNHWNQREVARIVEAIIRWKLRSWTMNAEIDFKVKGSTTAAVNLVGLLTKTLAAHPAKIDVPVGISTFKYVSSHPEFPFWGFLQGCDFAAPQVYQIGSKYPVPQLERSVAEWKAVLSTIPGKENMPFVVAGAAWKEGDWRPSGEEVMAFSLAAKAMPEVIGVNYWEHYYPFGQHLTDIVEALAAFDWEAEKVVEPVPVVWTVEQKQRAQAAARRAERLKYRNMEVVA